MLVANSGTAITASSQLTCQARARLMDSQKTKVGSEKQTCASIQSPAMLGPAPTLGQMAPASRAVVGNLALLRAARCPLSGVKRTSSPVCPIQSTSSRGHRPVGTKCIDPLTMQLDHRLGASQWGPIVPGADPALRVCFLPTALGINERTELPPSANRGAKERWGNGCPAPSLWATSV